MRYKHDHATSVKGSFNIAKSINVEAVANLINM